MLPAANLDTAYLWWPHVRGINVANHVASMRGKKSIDHGISYQPHFGQVHKNQYELSPAELRSYAFEDLESSMENDEKTAPSAWRVRYRARLAYDGTSFSGFQTQGRRKRTVQHVLQEVLSRRFLRPIVIVAAGRTDTGVHARGQAFHFDLLPNDFQHDEGFTRELECTMNSMLPRDVRVWNLSRVPPPNIVINSSGRNVRLTWHAIYNTEKKLYSYRIATGYDIDPLQRYTRTHIPEPIDVERLQNSLRHFEGTHDFRAFAGAIERNQKKTQRVMRTVRTINSIDLIDEGGGNFRIDFMLKGAMYKMIRNIVGTALEVSKGRFEETSMLQLLHQKDLINGSFARRDNPSKPAAPQGLTLEWVFYHDF